MIPNRCVDMQHFLYLKYYIWSELLVCIQANDKNDSVGSETHKDCAEIRFKQPAVLVRPEI